MDKDSEKYLESYLRDRVKQMGGQCLKWVSPGTRGVPDRLVLMPGGRVDFVELKSKGEKPGKLQLFWHKILRNLGFRVYVIDTYIGLNLYFWELEEYIKNS